jgi:hypothetical protein
LNANYFNQKSIPGLKFFDSLITGIIIVLVSPAAQAQDIFAGYEHLFTSPRQYIAYQTNEAIHIDGKIKESSWNNAPWSDFFKDIEGDKKPAPAFNTRFKILWDTQNIYVAAELEEPAVWANIKEHDAVVFYDNDFEIFIDPDGDTHNYFEIEVNALNTIFDLFLSKPYRNGGAILVNWDAQHLKSAVSVKGKINNAKRKDHKWFVEMAIPFRSVSLGNGVQVPKDQSVWRINFSRVEWDTEVIAGAYVKKTDSVNHRLLPEHNWVWSPQGVIDMHLPERWGYLQFSTQSMGATDAYLPLPVAERYKKYLWLLYYKQQEYRNQHQQYATALSQLNFPALVELDGVNCTISLEANTTQYKAVINALPGKEGWQINHEGKIYKVVIP